MLWTKFKYRLTLIYKILLLHIGFKKYLLKNRYGERILVFHGVDLKGETCYNSRFVSTAYFEAFIQYITTHFNVISIEDYYQKKFKKDTLNIALTFDDGYLNNYKYAIPILKKYNAPASFYITTIHNDYSFLWPDFIDLVSFYTTKKEILFNGSLYLKNKKNEFIHHGISLKTQCKNLSFTQIQLLFNLFETDWMDIKDSLSDYWELMHPHHIKEIATDPLFTIGSHAHTHANLASITVDEAISEITTSKSLLETYCDTTITEFAFPFGYYNQELIDLCKKNNFDKILLVDYTSQKDSTDVTLRNRFVINPYISLEYQLVCLLKGSYF
ncbi:polysaccharide deacetylase family protein [Aquimarina rhabdastrellae]